MIEKKKKKKKKKKTWILRRFITAAERLAKSATWRNRRRGFLTIDTADLHRCNASSERFLGSSSKSLRSFCSIFVEMNISRLSLEKEGNFYWILTQWKGLKIVAKSGLSGVRDSERVDGIWAMREIYLKYRAVCSGRMLWKPASYTERERERETE